MQSMKTLQTTGFYGDTTRWFIGTVIRNTGDPLDLGRLKVRIVGVHDHPELTDADLPWASVVIPTTEIGIVHGRGPRIGVGAQVVGIFLDGPQSQQPLVIGSIPYTLTPTETQVRQSEQRGGSFEDNYASIKEEGPPGTTSSSEYFRDIPTPAGNSKVEQAFNWFISDIGGGYDPEQSAGIVGNLIVESANFDDNVISTQRRGDGGKAHGIAQWHPPRWQPFLDLCYRTRASELHELSPYTLEAQLFWVTRELETTESTAKTKLQATKRADHAAIAFMRKYERPSFKDTNSSFRDPPMRASGKIVKKRSGEDERVAAALNVFDTYALVGGPS